jgi:hypothetical protein
MPDPLAQAIAQARSVSGQPHRRTLAGLVALVVAVHLCLLLGLSGSLDLQLPSNAATRVSPLQTRMLAAPPSPAAQAPVAPLRPAAPRTRIAQQVSPTPLEPQASVLAEVLPAEASPTPPEQVSEQATEPTPDKLTSPTAAQPLPSETAAGTDVPLPAAPFADVGMALPDIPLGALPPSSLLVYKLTGQEKGLNYYASGELRWQHNEQAYALGLSVKAFLVGSRHWRSVGDITSAGLAPRRFSDSWRSERASHFDRDKNRVVFSSNAPEATLLAGAQDQISLYVQLAAAMTGSPERFVPGTRLQIQTITLRDALPWTLTLEQTETLTVDNQPLATAKWRCQPRNRFDAKVEFWVAEKHQWLPVRIRITQASGSFIDLNLSEHQALPALAPVGNPT